MAQGRRVASKGRDIMHQDIREGRRRQLIGKTKRTWGRLIGSGVHRGSRARWRALAGRSKNRSGLRASHRRTWHRRLSARAASSRRLQAMQYRTFGRTGLLVSELCFGTTGRSGAGSLGRWGTTAQAEADALVMRADRRRHQFFDTADVYAEGESEQILGAALREHRKKVVLATKSTWPRGGGTERCRPVPAST